MASVHDVTAYLLQTSGRQCTWKLQHLLYYSQAWHLAWEGAPLFSERIEAWPPGPCAPDVFNRHRGEFSLEAWPAGTPRRLTKAGRDVIDIVADTYAVLDADQVTYLIKAEPPWRAARAGLHSLDPSNNVITHDAMRGYYSALDTSDNALDVKEISWEGWDDWSVMLS